MISNKKGKRFGQEQILRILGELKAGKSAEEICRCMGLDRWSRAQTF